MKHITLAGRGWELRYPINALCALEEQYGPIDRMCRTAFSSVRALLWCGLITAHPDMTPQKAGELIEEHLRSGGSLHALSRQLAEALADSCALREDTP